MQCPSWLQRCLKPLTPTEIEAILDQEPCPPSEYQDAYDPPYESDEQRDASNGVEEKARLAKLQRGVIKAEQMAEKHMEPAERDQFLWVLGEVAECIENKEEPDTGFGRVLAAKLMATSDDEEDGEWEEVKEELDDDPPPSMTAEDEEAERVIAKAKLYGHVSRLHLELANKYQIQLSADQLAQAEAGIPFELTEEQGTEILERPREQTLSDDDAYDTDPTEALSPQEMYRMRHRSSVTCAKRIEMSHYVEDERSPKLPRSSDDEIDPHLNKQAIDRWVEMMEQPVEPFVPQRPMIRSKSYELLMRDVWANPRLLPY